MLLEEVLLYLNQIVDLTEDFRLARESASDFLKHKKRKSLDLALAVKQKFDEYVHYRYMGDEIPLKDLHNEEIKKIMNELIKALEQDKFNEHWKIASNLIVRIEKTLKLIKYGTA